MPIKVAVFNNKGGVGKTTVSIILTQLALQNKEKVLAIDQDEQNNFNVSISYLKNDPNFKNLFSFKTVLNKEDFKSQNDWLIIDCPPALFNQRSIFALRNADFILIPVRPDQYSTLHISKIREIAGDYKYLLQFPLVKIGFTEGSIHDKYQDAKIASQQICKHGYTVIGDFPIYHSINANLSSGLAKWFSLGLSAHARKPFELLHIRLKLLYQKLQELRQNKKQHEYYGYYDDPENPDITLWGND